MLCPYNPISLYILNPCFSRFDESGEKVRTIRYSVDITQSLSLPFYPMFVNIVKQQHGDMAEVILEELLHQGSSFKDSLLEICLVRLQSSVKDKHTVNMETLHSIFEVFMQWLENNLIHFHRLPFVSWRGELGIFYIFMYRFVPSNFMIYNDRWIY